MKKFIQITPPYFEKLPINMFSYEKIKQYIFNFSFNFHLTFVNWFIIQNTLDLFKILPIFFFSISS